MLGRLVTQPRRFRSSVPLGYCHVVPIGLGFEPPHVDCNVNCREGVGSGRSGLGRKNLLCESFIISLPEKEGAPGVTEPNA